jgi:hypothetical protein
VFAVLNQKTDKENVEADIGRTAASGLRWSRNKKISAVAEIFLFF